MKWNSNQHFYTYPHTIFDVFISSFANKILDCNLIPLSSCNMEGSPLTEKTNSKIYVRFTSLLTENWVEESFVNEIKPKGLQANCAPSNCV